MTKLCKCNLLDTTENGRFCVKEFRLYLIGASLRYYNKISDIKGPQLLFLMHLKVSGCGGLLYVVLAGRIVPVPLELASHACVLCGADSGLHSARVGAAQLLFPFWGQQSARESSSQGGNRLQRQQDHRGQQFLICLHHVC